MAYSAKIIADSISQLGFRLTTFEITLPRIVLSELNTHRDFSRNSASSRAIPIEKMQRRVKDDPFTPVYWGKNQKGMSAEQELSYDECQASRRIWLDARDAMLLASQKLLEVGVHKQITNRLLEPFLWHTVIITATQWENFFALRTHADAQPEIRHIALMMQDLYNLSTKPEIMAHNAWHLPLVSDQKELLKEGWTPEQIRLISVGRCARVSYLTHNGTRDPIADIMLAQNLKLNGHMSPFEHVARPMKSFEMSNETLKSNFVGWMQYRKSIKNENNFKLALKERNEIK